ncbi:MAG TPA: response regulator [Thermoanaerobaculia bacterium]
MLRRRPRILVLDDDTAMQRLVSVLLRREGYNVDTVAGGSEALEKMERREYVALLLDIMTPTDGAMTVIRHLREERPDLLERVILVTASPDSVLKAFSGDELPVVHKPFTAEELMAAVKERIGNS